MKKEFRSYLRMGLVRMVLAGVSIFGGCSGDFWKTDFIGENTKEVFERKQSLELQYQKESGIEMFDHPKSRRRPTITKNPDNSCTLFYECQFIEGVKLEKIVKEQIKDATTSLAEGTNQLIIKVNEESQLDYLGKLLEKSDKMPSQVLLKLNVYNDYGDHTQDFTTRFDFFKTGPELTSSTTSYLPGAETRIDKRAELGTKYGLGYEGKNFTIKAVLDVLESKGYVKHLYQTELLLSNGETGSLTEKENLPIPEFVVTGNNVVQTYKLQEIKSFFEATPVIYEDGLVKISFTAGIGSAKRPEGVIQWQVPVSDEVTISNVYLRVGEPFLVAGKANELEVAVRRKDPLLFFLNSKDWEKRVVRTYYEVTPYRIRYFKEEEPERLTYDIEILEGNLLGDSIPEPNELTLEPVSEPNQPVINQKQGRFGPYLPKTEKLESLFTDEGRLNFFPYGSWGLTTMPSKSWANSDRIKSF